MNGGLVTAIMRLGIGVWHAWRSSSRHGMTALHAGWVYCVVVDGLVRVGAWGVCTCALGVGV